jgi:hypothetical protein
MAGRLSIALSSPVKFASLFSIEKFNGVNIAHRLAGWKTWRLES